MKITGEDIIAVIVLASLAHSGYALIVFTSNL